MQQLLADSEIVLAIRKLIDAAEHSIVILQYQFRVPIHPRHQMHNILQALLRAASRGVSITILLNNPNRPKRPGPQHGAVRTWLAHPGIKILHSTGQQILHTKLLITDYKTLILGSHNLSQQSFATSRNLSILTDDEHVVKSASEITLALIKRANNGQP